MIKMSIIYANIAKRIKGEYMNIDNKAVNELRVLSAEIITNAKSGHTGIALGSAPILYSLYANVLAVD